MRKIAITIFYLCIVMSAAALDVALFPALGGFWLYMNVSLALGLFLVVILNRRIALIIYLCSTIVIGLAASQMLLVPLLVGAGVIIFIDWLVETIFTNRSYYTLITMGLVGWFLYYLVYALLVLGLGFVSDSLINPVISLSWIFSIFLNAIVVFFFFSLAYMVTRYMSKRFKSYFVLSDH